MNVQTRLEANAILDRLVADGSTFLRNDARRLIELIPVTQPSRFALKGIFKGPRPSIRGHSPGHGDVELKEEAKEKKITLNVPASHKIGGYVVIHTPGSINIELMWAETKADQTGLSCLLVYDGPTKEPEELRIAAQRSLSLLFLTLNYVSYVPWKQPGPT
ncbi:hypothetical protein [Microvirga splendida]|uniref:Uncharacterized protein n=1 Tax=Microvirga splendida TaxID=2795727 RepID=A0ABS0Y2A4_9HYPH|nr:hypothetical protein [Microvirga splendida]MBJ6126033.1 hypothetical protein [Microvirga splendida]